MHNTMEGHQARQEAADRAREEADRARVQAEEAARRNPRRLCRGVQ